MSSIFSTFSNKIKVKSHIFFKFMIFLLLFMNSMRFWKIFSYLLMSFNLFSHPSFFFSFSCHSFTIISSPFIGTFTNSINTVSMATTITRTFIIIAFTITFSIRTNNISWICSRKFNFISSILTNLLFSSGIEMNFT